MEVDFYIVIGADVYEPGSEYNQFNSTNSDNPTKGNNDWKEDKFYQSLSLFKVFFKSDCQVILGLLHFQLNINVYKLSSKL